MKVKPTTEQQIGEIVADLQNRGVTSSDLDELVHELQQDQHLDELNTLEDDAEQDSFIEKVANEATQINNGGLDSQVKWLCNYYGTAEYLTTALRLFFQLPKAA